MRACRTRRASRRRGATALELALVLSPLLMMLLGILEYSRYLMIRNLADNAAREGARFAVVHTYDKTTAQIQAQVQTMLAGQDGNIGSLTINVYKADASSGSNTGVWTDARFGDGIAVEITGVYTPVTPKLLFMNNTIPIQAKSVMRSEAN